MLNLKINDEMLPEVLAKDVKKLEVDTREPESEACIVVTPEGKLQGTLNAFEVQMEQASLRERANANTKREFAEYFEAVGYKLPDWDSIHRAAKKVRHDKNTRHREFGGQKKKRNKTLKYLKKQKIRELQKEETRVQDHLAIPGITDEIAKVLKEEMADIQEQLKSLTMAS